MKKHANQNMREWACFAGIWEIGSKCMTKSQPQVTSDLVGLVHLCLACYLKEKYRPLSLDWKNPSTGRQREHFIVQNIANYENVYFGLQSWLCSQRLQE